MGTKRYFNDIENKQTIMITFAANSIVKQMTIIEIFHRATGIVEVTKGQWRRLKYQYELENETSLTMTICH